MISLPLTIQHKLNQTPAIMKNIQVPQSFVCPAISSRLSRTSASFATLAVLAVFAGCLWPGPGARAQVPTNQLHFAFTDASGTTTPSDTSLNPGAIVTTVTMYNAASPAVAVNLHGAVGSGVANPGVASTIRSLDFSPDVITAHPTHPANSRPTGIPTAGAETGPPPARGSGNAALAFAITVALL